MEGSTNFALSARIEGLVRKVCGAPLRMKTPRLIPLPPRREGNYFNDIRRRSRS
jgi:hypothetical protein